MDYDLYIACACNWKTRIGAYGYILNSEVTGDHKEGQFGYKDASVNTMLVYALLDTIRLLPAGASVLVHTNNKVLLSWIQDRGRSNDLVATFLTRINGEHDYEFVYENKNTSRPLFDASFLATRYQKELETEWDCNMIPKYGE